MKILWIVLATAILFVGADAFGQALSISGRIIDAQDTSALSGVPVTIAPIKDTQAKTGGVTDFDGFFSISGLAAGEYQLTINYIGYKTIQKNLTLVNSDFNLGTLKMEISAQTLKTVKVAGRQTRAQQLGDTTQFNSDAYKTNPDASAEDLLKKMPGITSDGSGVKVNGESVKEVLVDGKPFFGDDPNTALKNLPAEIIDKIQVFDKMSDQAQFTGFDDGNTSKSINIVTKRGRNTGQFGKVYAGYGYGQDINTQNRYQVGGNINFFNGDRRISLIGMSNNINQQNFSIEDITGSVGASTGGRGRGGRGGRGGWGGGSDNFLVGQQGGISNTNSIGLNYSDNWGKKVKISGSYFFNANTNNNNSEVNRNYFTTSDSTLLYNEIGTVTSTNQNHRANLRLEYNIDSNNSIIIAPRLSVQDYSSNSLVNGSNTFSLSTDNGSSEGTNIGSINNRNESTSLGYNFSNMLLYRHRFKKERRTVSLSFNTQINNRNGDGNTYSLNQYPLDTTLLDLQNTNMSKSYTLSGEINYTEPLGKMGQLSVNYTPSFTNTTADKNTDSLNNYTGAYDIHAPLLSNESDNTYTTHRAGLSYRIGDRKINAMLSLNGQYALLQGTQYEPYAFTLDRSFTNLLPRAMFNYRFSESSNIRLFYRTSTNPPSITQLQDVLDISNPLLLKGGNPDLKQDYNHMFVIRYGNTNKKTSNSFFAFASGNVINNYIGNETIIPASDTTYNGFNVNRGTQITRPVNLDGYFSGRTFLTFGLPVDLIKSNLNLNAGFNFTHAPSLINRQKNFSDNYTFNGGVVIGSNISENLDFTLSYTANYSLVTNTLQTQSDNSYFSHLAGARVNWIFLKGFVFNTSLEHNLYSGLSDATFNQSFLLWNAYLGYKFLKNRALEARISAYDILNQNKAISRNITETYVEDIRSQVLTQYFMFTVTYTLRNFKSSASNEQENETHNGGRFRPGGFHPGSIPGNSEVLP